MAWARPIWKMTAGPEGAARVEHVLRDVRWDRDLALWEALVNGDPQAIGLLHKRFAGQVNRLVWRTLGDPVEHEDVVQDVFLSVLEGIARVRNARALEAWVVRVTLNQVRSRIRERTRERRLPCSPVEVAQPDFEGRVLLDRCLQIVAAFPEKEGRAFLLARAEGYVLEEVARLCGCSHATAKRRLQAADRRFRRRAMRDPDLGRLLTEAKGA